jgi:N-methylhydantoinase A
MREPERSSASGHSPPRLRLGVDIGGTFTDLVLLNEATGAITIEKVASTPSDPSVSFHTIVTRGLARAGGEPGDVSALAHGTTVATNCIIEGKTAACALLTTEGFRDILEIARQIKPEPFNLFFDKPRPLVPRHRVREAHERLDPAGGVLEALAPETVLAAARSFAAEGVEAVAICFLHSYINPRHERLAAEILGRELPGVHLSLSSEVCPEFREYFRASTTVVNAAIAPIVSTYLSRVETKLAELGLVVPLCIMQSNGGIYTSEVARTNPVHIVESGPAAGVIMAAHLGALTGRRNVISLDIGGTTAKAGLIQDGAPKISHEFEVGAQAHGRRLNARATGYPIKSGVVDLVEIGAGGGSVGWVDSGGALRVGPHSAGADPGPACYGRGGAAPTLTDAHLLLGHLNPDFFLGGQMKLSRAAAEQAVASQVASRLGLSAAAAALGMVRIANSSMIEALGLVSVERGLDPRDFTLVVFGGAGPLHANAIAHELRMPEVLIPLSPGVSSALGLLLADMKHDFVRTYIQPLDLVDLEFVQHALDEFERQGRALLQREGIAPENQQFLRALDMRLKGQSFELKVPLDPGTIGVRHLGRAVDAFHELHARTYGSSFPAEPVEIVNLRLTAHGIIPKPQLRRAEEPSDGDTSAQRALKGDRRVCFEAADGFASTPIYDRYALAAGARVVGPAILEEFDSTVVIHPGYEGVIDSLGSVHLLPTAAPPLQGPDGNASEAPKRAGS